MDMQVLRQRVLDYIDEHREDVIEYLRQLIRVPSVNPWFHDDPGPSNEDLVQDLIAARLTPLGATVDRWEPDALHLAKYEGKPGYYPGRDFTGRPNQAVVLKGTGRGRSMLLTGHVDVVKAGSGWTVDPFDGVRKDGFIYGRGAVDMKGGIAAMVCAVEAVAESVGPLAGDVIVGTVVDEEAGGMGTLAFIDRGYRADGCILTESTGLDVATLCRGILWGKLTVFGRSGHIENPQGDWRKGGAVDAIQMARLFLNHFDHLNLEWARTKVHPLIPIPCQVKVAQFNAGEYPTAYANKAEIVINVQYLPREKDENFLGGRVKAEIEALVQRVAQTDPWLVENPPKLEWMIDADCGETPADHPFVECLSASLKELGCKPKLFGIGSHTDMGWFVNVGIPTVNFGPGDARLAHQNDERVPEDELITATKAIALTLLSWCGVGERSVES
jgi:acetylornithine deacetylase